MQSTKKSSTRPVPSPQSSASPAASPESVLPAEAGTRRARSGRPPAATAVGPVPEVAEGSSGGGASGSGGGLANAFTPRFLERARRRDGALAEEEAAPDARALAAGPWEVEGLGAGFGRLHAVVRRGEPMEGGGGAVALCRSYPEALQLAAVLPSLARENRLALSDRRKRLGLPLHDGRQFLAHVAPDGPAAVPELAAHLHVVRHLAADPSSLALLHRSLGFEALVLLGRELARRME